ncbi:hypothetical protein GYMLUDRAFT_324907 [Collybiopsis luxurians FD-317 M1]|nr:hypothetical protein GYMLUDRAFT_324907 [Collybiopsis luxurians FD-317 M1]
MARSGKWPERRKPNPKLVESEFPPVQNLDAFAHDWFSGGTGGGLAAHFGEPLRINEFSSRRLEWLVKNYRSSTSTGKQFRQALDKYYEGLKQFMKESHYYRYFIVPFGKTYKGKKLDQVLDKGWLRWIVKKKNLQERFPLFLAAVKLWLANPRQYEQTRDIGEFLGGTEYEDDLGLDQDDDTDLADFIVSDSAEVEVESDKQSDSEENSENVAEGSSGNEEEGEDHEQDQVSYRISLSTCRIPLFIVFLPSFQIEETELPLTPKQNSLSSNRRAFNSASEHRSLRSNSSLEKPTPRRRPLSTPSRKMKRKFRKDSDDSDSSASVTAARKKHHRSKNNQSAVDFAKLGRDTRIRPPECNDAESSKTSRGPILLSDGEANTYISISVCSMIHMQRIPKMR